MSRERLPEQEIPKLGRSKTKAKLLREFCRGNPKTPHVPVIRANPYYAAHWSKERRVCKWGTWWKPSRSPIRQFQKQGEPRWRRSERDWTSWHWSCFHQEVCENCGKVLDPSLVGPKCPDFHEWTEADYPDERLPGPGEPNGPPRRANPS